MLGLSYGMAFGQVRHACKAPNGTLVLSDRPCDVGGATAAPGVPLNSSAKAAATQQSFNSADYVQYLSAHCGSMREGIRTGPARRVNPQNTAQLQREYQRDCAEEEAAAIRKVSERRSDARAQRNEAERAQTLNANRQVMMQQQCDESKRILFDKRKRTDLTEGEKADLLRFEENHKSRCG